MNNRDGQKRVITIRQLFISKQGAPLESVIQKYKDNMKLPRMYSFHNSATDSHIDFIADEDLSRIDIEGGLPSILEELSYVIEGVNFRLAETTNYERIVKTLLPLATEIYFDGRDIHFTWNDKYWRIIIEEKGSSV